MFKGPFIPADSICAMRPDNPFKPNPHRSGLIPASSGNWSTLMFDILQVISAPRFAVPFLISIGIAVGVYYLTGQEPSSAAIAFFIGMIGLCAGVVFHLAGGKPDAD